MGYHIRTGLVKDHESTLIMILEAADAGKSLRYDCKRPEDLNRLKYQFNRILKATSVLINECGGIYVGLRNRVKVREDWKHLAIIIEPAIPTGTLNTLIPTQPNEHDAIERLKQFEGQMDLVSFTPSYSFVLNDWITELTKIGFELMPDPDNPSDFIGGRQDNGDLQYGVARIAKKTPTGFDMLSAFED